MSNWCSLDVGDLWVSKTSSGILLGLFSGNLTVWDNNGLDDVKGVTSGGVSTGHLGVKLGNSTGEGVVSEFFVHVDDTGSGEILEDDTVVLDGVSASLENFTDGNDLSLSSSDLVLSLHLVPES